MPTKTEELVAACKAQHDAIDILFAMLIELTSSGCVPDKVFHPSQSGRPWAALVAGNKAVARAEAEVAEPDEYTFAHLEAGACMWEHVLQSLRRHREGRNPWEEYREAYGMCELLERVVRHAPVLEVAYQEAVKNGYDKGFDWEYVPKYMEDHVTRILT